MHDRSAFRLKWLSLIAAAVTGCLIGVVLTTFLSGHSGLALAQPAYARSIAPIAAESEQAIIAAIGKVGPAVVNIDTIFNRPKTQIPSQIPPQLRRFFEQPFPQEGQASGVIISQDGYILTNNHVVENARSVRVTLADGRNFDATVVGTDPLSDIGVVKIAGDALPTAELGTSATVPIGGWLIAIGNPFGYENTVTVGVLSARNRRLRAPTGVGLQNLLQTDAAINPGNSGGALVDIEGKVVGIPTAIIPFAQGIGFAIAAETARSVADQIIQTGHVVHPYIGIYYTPVTAEVQKELKLPSQQGVVVVKVEPDSPAARAGVQGRDVIVRIGGRDVTSQDVVADVVRNSKVGEKLPLAVIRDGKEIELSVTIGERPPPQNTTALPRTRVYA